MAYFTNIKTNTKEKIANKFVVTISDITNEYSTFDMDIYSNLHHENTDEQVYNIGYSFKPSYSYPDCHFNITDKPVIIEYQLDNEPIDLSNYKISVMFF